MTKPRDWPNGAADARDRSAEEAVKIIRLLTPILERHMTQEELIRRVATSLVSVQLIARILENVGAQTKP